MRALGAVGFTFGHASMAHQEDHLENQRAAQHHGCLHRRSRSFSSGDQQLRQPKQLPQQLSFSFRNRYCTLCTVRYPDQSIVQFIGQFIGHFIVQFIGQFIVGSYPSVSHGVSGADLRAQILAHALGRWRSRTEKDTIDCNVCKLYNELSDELYNGLSE